MPKRPNIQYSYPKLTSIFFLLQFFNLSTALSATLKLLYQISLHQDLCLPLIVRNYWSCSSSKTFSSRQDFLPMSDQASAAATTEAPFFQNSGTIMTCWMLHPISIFQSEDHIVPIHMRIVTRKSNKELKFIKFSVRLD